jgi:hypothetical protein
MDRIQVYEFELFKRVKHIDHGIFTRADKIDKHPLVFLNQVHGTGIRVLKQEDPDLDGLAEMLNPKKEWIVADAIITDIKNVYLVIRVADCQAVILAEPQKKVIANIHSGWRGSIENIIGDCVNKMVTEFGCRPENILAGISPSLGPCCSEFVNYRDEIPQSLWAYKIRDRDYFDFWAMSKDQLKDRGIKPDHIENMEICTKCNMDQFYSYRGQGTAKRFAAVVGMIS